VFSIPSLRFLCLLLCVALSDQGHGADIPKAPVPKSPYLPVVYRYADTMLKNGRDTYGPQKTGLFLSALDRTTLAPLTNVPPAPKGIQPGERVGETNGPLVGANPQHDENLLRLLYLLSDLSGKPQYREAADASLKWFLENARSPAAQLLPWGAHASWDVIKDQAATRGGAGPDEHRFSRPWLLWERCFALAPEASRQYALGLWQHQSAIETERVTAPKALLQRHAGFYLRTWAVAYARTKDDQFLRAVDPKEALRHHAVNATLSLAIDCDGASYHVPEPYAGRLRATASLMDALFCQLTQDVRNERGFRYVSDSRTPLWRAIPGGTTAEVGMMCVSRYDNTGRADYLKLILAAADAYIDSLPAADDDVWPVTFGQAISLELAAWRHSADWKYMERARKLGDIAMEKFWGTNALPRASFQTEHYESITGADTLALALVELHLHVLHITAVRCPPNTIDR
jgi:hypothetical protein